MSYIMTDALYERLLCLSKKQIIDLMESSLSEMQSYNGQSINRCILRTLGQEEDDDGRIKIPSVKELKELLK